MGLIGKIGTILNSAFGLVDDLHTSDEEKLELKSGLLQIQTGVIAQVIQAQSKMAELQTSVILAEANSSNWLTTSWRPITMLTFLVLIVLSQVGVTAPVPAEMWPLLKLGLGGYVIGRSFEKTVPSVLASLKTKEEA